MVTDSCKLRMMSVLQYGKLMEGSQSCMYTTRGICTFKGAFQTLSVETALQGHLCPRSSFGNNACSMLLKHGLSQSILTPRYVHHLTIHKREQMIPCEAQDTIVMQHYLALRWQSLCPSETLEQSSWGIAI